MAASLLLMEIREFTVTTADGLSLHGRRYRQLTDTAPLPVICLHGLTRNERDFETLAPVAGRAGR